MSSSARVESKSDEEKWTEWQKRGLDGDRRRTVAMKWGLALIAIALGALFGTLL
jgi:hypothetical protein